MLFYISLRIEIYVEHFTKRKHIFIGKSNGSPQYSRAGFIELCDISTDYSGEKETTKTDVLHREEVSPESVYFISENQSVYTPKGERIGMFYRRSSGGA